MSQADNDEFWGCVIPLLILAGSGYWIYTDWFAEDEVVVAPPPIIVPTPERLTGEMPVAFFDDGTVWRLDTGTVTGPRTSRQGWVTEDYSKVKAVSWRETKTLWRAACDEGSYSTLSSIRYDAKGAALMSQTPKEPEKSYAAPKSNAATVVSALCHKGFDQLGE